MSSFYKLNIAIKCICLFKKKKKAVVCLEFVVYISSILSVVGGGVITKQIALYFKLGYTLTVLDIYLIFFQQSPSHKSDLKPTT